MFCSCMSKFRHEGQPGGCEDCHNRRQVYDNNGLQICLHHDVITPERLMEQRGRLRHLKDKLSGTFPARKKPSWENLDGLREACLQRCVPGVTNKDGQDAYDPRDIVLIPSMNTKACEAWLNERTEGAVIALVYIYPSLHPFHRLFDFAFHYLHARWMYSLKQSCCRGTQHSEATITFGVTNAFHSCPNKGDCCVYATRLLTYDWDGFNWCTRCEVFQRAT
jgi:hypothetical protein